MGGVECEVPLKIKKGDGELAAAWARLRLMLRYGGRRMPVDDS